MHDSLTFSHLDENLFQGIMVVSSTPKLSSSDWLKRIIENSKNKSNLEFQPVLENGEKMLRFDTSLDPSMMAKTLNINKPVEPIRCHCAMLDNKYYTTQIYLIELDEPLEFPDRFYDFIHGIIIYLDNNDENCLKNLDKWTEYIDLMENCAIKILSCENASEKNVISRIDIQNYCIDKGFELVELMPQDDSGSSHDNNDDEDDDELEDDFKEHNSFERLYKAIQAYVWPNLNYKEKHSSSYISSRSSDTLIKQINRLNFLEERSSNSSSSISYRSKLFNNNDDDGGKVSSSNNVETLVTSSTTSNNHRNTHNQTQVKSPISEENISEQEAHNFESMLSKFSEMKEKASKLEDEERKRYAEQVAIAFWNSISDDKDEVLFSSDEDDEDRERGSDPNHVYV